MSTEGESPGEGVGEGGGEGVGVGEGEEPCSLMFANVWVKLEVEEEQEVPLTPDTLCLPLRRSDRKPKQRKPYKKPTQILRCDQCHYTTRYKPSLKFHIMGHDNSTLLSCDHCPYTTKYPISLKRHNYIQHECKNDPEKIKQLPTFHCSTCAYTTYFKWNLHSHERKHTMEKKFKCTLCPYSTAYNHNFMKHSRTHKKLDTTYYCDKCPFSTKFEGHITRHLAKIHLEVSDKASRCEYCPYSTKTRWRLNIHRNRSRQEKALKCAHCTFETNYHCAYREHKRSHTDKVMAQIGNQKWMESMFTKDAERDDITSETKKPDVLKMYNDIMNNIANGTETKIYNDTTKMEDSSSYPNEKDVKNDLIPQDSLSPRNILNVSQNNLNVSRNNLNVSQNNLSVSQNNSYLPQNEFDASLSNLNVSQLTEHEKTNHYLLDPNCEVEWSNIQVIESCDGERPFQCVTCSYRAKFKASVQRHYQRHHTQQNKPFKCVNCDFSTKTKDQISLHNKRSRTDDIITCKLCPFTTNFKCQYGMHEKTHFPFKCVYCEYTCKKKYDMQKHFSNVHLGNGLKCTYCEYVAPRKETLRCHEAVHTGHKPYKCQICDYSAVRRSLLDNHLLRLHHRRVRETVLTDDKLESLKKKDVVSDAVESVKVRLVGECDPLLPH